MAESKQAKGGKARAKKLTKEERSEIARSAAIERWAKKKVEQKTDSGVAVGDLPEAVYKGTLELGGAEIPCYVLNSGERIIGRTSVTEMLTQIKGGGDLEKYLGVNAFKPFVDQDLVLERMIPFRLPEVEGLERQVKGLRSDNLVDICQGLVNAMNAHARGEAKLTNRQQQIAIQASAFLSACAKTGLDALIDEATGYQYDRPYDALQVKLRAYLSEELRPWEKTFPDELWMQFARLTNWKGSVTQRPKYWGKLVNELVYHYLDPDVATWLKENAPAPRAGKNYHQWMSEQFGLKKLVEHIWKLIGIAATCDTMPELRQKMAELHGKALVQFTLPFDLPRT